MTRSTPWRLMILHLSHIFLMDERTFMSILSFLKTYFARYMILPLDRS